MGKRSTLDEAPQSQYKQDGATTPPSPPHRSAATNRRPAPGRHNRKCSVCRHPDRAAIDQDFLHRRSPDRIAADYGIADHSSVYRHAHATGLFRRRNAGLRHALAPLIEQAALVAPSADAIVRAVCAFAHINDDGHWIEPPRHVMHDSNRQGNYPLTTSTQRWVVCEFEGQGGGSLKMSIREYSLPLAGGHSQCSIFFVGGRVCLARRRLQSSLRLWVQSRAKLLVCAHV